MGAPKENGHGTCAHGYPQACANIWDKERHEKGQVPNLASPSAVDM